MSKLLRGGELRYGWTLALTLLTLTTLLTLWLLWPSVLSITHVWLNSQTYAHGMLIPALALFLAWTRRRELAQQVPRPWAWGLLWIGAAALAWMLARTVEVETVQHFALVAMLPGLVLLWLGPGIAWTILFPLVSLFFAVPFGDFLIPPMIDLTAWFSVLLLKLTGVPVFMDGHYISIPAADFVVVEACSGVRYLIAAVALGLVYSYLSYRSLWRRLAFMALAVALPILANVVRVYVIIMTAHLTDGRITLAGHGHIVVGWVLFGLVMLLLFWLGSFWADRPHPAPARAETASSMALKAPWSPVNLSFLGLLLLGLVSMLGVARGVEVLVQHRAQQVMVEAPIGLPSAVPGWEGPEAVSPSWRPDYHEADAELVGLYRDGEAAVELYLLQYRNRGRGTELISWRNQIHGHGDNDRWRRSATAVRSLTDATGRELRLQEMLLRSRRGDQLRLVWYWYQVGNYRTLSPIEVKLRELQAVLAGDGRGAFLVVLSTTGDELTLVEARSRLERFLQTLPHPLGYMNG
ncbi:MAG: exosortase A [Gammaproteobacteria bacterium]|nr:exosortase A [Gammaproteobacteria bacterium]